MDYYSIDDINDYLEHHGILGQSWGHRNGPPYPLGSGKHSAAEKKAGWRKSLKKKTDSIKKKIKQKSEENKEKKKAELHKKHMSDPATMYRYKDEFTIDEINAAVARFGAEKRLKDITPNAFRDATSFVKSLSDFSSSSIKLYDNVAKTVNTFGDLPDNKKWKTINNNKKEKKNDDK